jgi:hypothetical protein
MSLHWLRRGLDVAKTSRSVILIPALVVALAALAACGGDDSAADGGDAPGGADAQAVTSQLFPDNFKGVCSGASVSNATAYDPAGKAHKALYFATYKDDLMDQSSSLPGDWTVQWAAEGNPLTAIDLVVCARRTAAQQVKVCDGYKDDDRPTQNKVRWHTATYELSIHEAKTGKQLGDTTTVEATDADCPMFWSFDGDTDTDDGYAALADSAVADFARPHIAPSQ